MEDASPPETTRPDPPSSNDLRHPPLDLVLTTTAAATSSPPNSPASVPLRELLCYSPSPLRRSRTRLAEKIETIEDPAQRRKVRNRSGQLIGSPRNVRRSRRRLDQEERDSGLVEEAGNVKVKKRRNSGRTTTKRDKLILNASVTPNSEDLVILDRLGLLFADLVMWRDVAKSSLWFGFGCICFLSSCFASGVSFSIFSGMSQLGLVLLGVSFFSNTIRQRNNVSATIEFKLTDEDVLRASRLFLPYVNYAISKGRKIFSGEPSMTLKVAPVLLLGAQYGHLFTLKRICALGFFTSFIVPRLYSNYYIQINTKAEFMRWWIMEVWRGCNHKKLVAGLAVTAFWNLSSIKTRIVTAFIALVIMRYNRHCYPVELKQDEQVQVEAKQLEGKKDETNRHSQLEVERKTDEKEKVATDEPEEKNEENKELVVVKRKYQKKKQVEDEQLQKAITVLEEELA